jgi:hypothetical protein
VELLIAVALFSVVSVSVYFHLQTGVLLYTRAGRDLSSINDYRLCFEKIEKELHNIVPFDEVEFKGEQDTLEFPAYVEVFKKGERCDDLYKVTYIFKNKSFFRILRPLKQKAFDADNEEKAVMISNVEGGAFEYAYVAPNGTVVWKNSWTPEVTEPASMVVPYGVRLSFTPVAAESRSSAGREPTAARQNNTDMPKITKTFMVPLGTLLEVKLNE